VREAEPASDFDFDASSSVVPVGVSELIVRGVPYLPFNLSGRATRLGCGSGPDLVVDGRTVRTAVTASPRDLFDGDPVPARLCGATTVRLPAGESPITLAASDAFVGEDLVLGSAPREAAGVASVDEQSPTRLSVESSDDYVAMRGNTNPGWEASSGGTPLEAQVFDGYRQGWRTAGHAAVVERFAPDGTYRAGLVLGLLTLLVLIAQLATRARSTASLPPPLREATSGPRLALLACAALVLLIAGWPGLVVGLLGGGAAALARRLRPAWEGWALVLCLTPAVLAYVFNPWQSSTWAGSWAWPHYVVVFILGAVSCWTVAARPLRRANDMPGRSTSQ
jgi:arabinofuranan 3-O-arabinosyltransferase